MTDTTQPKKRDLKIIVAGACVQGDCDCMKHDQQLATNLHSFPPFHNGCTCFMIEQDKTTPESPPQPKPGRALDERMAEIVGKAPLDFPRTREQQNLIVSELENDKPLQIARDRQSMDRPEWSPSTRIADAFEVMDQGGWRWQFIEQEETLSVDLMAIDSSGPERTAEAIFLHIPWVDFTAPDGTRNRPEAYSFGICWAALVWLEGQG